MEKLQKPIAELNDEISKVVQRFCRGIYIIASWFELVA